MFKKIGHGDCPWGDLDRDGIEIEEPEKGKFFEKVWGAQMTNEELIKQIDEMTYEELLRNWRFAPPGHEYFTGEVGEHYREVMKAKYPGAAEHSRLSKSMGWAK